MTRSASHIDDDASLREGRDVYLDENGFDLSGYTARWVELPFGPFTLRFPNTKQRQAVVPLHDLHHVATGYGTDYVGEAEIGAWELRAGCTTLVAWLLNGMACALGLVIAPRRTLRAFRRARGHTTLYKLQIPYDALMRMSVGEVRRQLGIPPGGQTEHPPRLHGHAPSARR